MSEINILPPLVVGSFAAIASVSEERLKIPNFLTPTLLLAGLCFNLACYGAAGLFGGLAGAVLGFSGVALFYLAGVMPADDVKLMTALGGWLGVPESACVLVAAAILSLAYASVWSIRQDGLHRLTVRLKIVFLQLGVITRHLLVGEHFGADIQGGQRRRGLPFAAIVAAVLLALVLWKHLTGWDLGK